MRSKNTLSAIGRYAIAIPAMGAILLGGTHSAIAEAEPQFSIDALSAGVYSTYPSARSASFRSDGLQLMQLGEGTVALVDTSLATLGIATAIKADGVEISWTPRSNARGYTVVRDNVKVADLGPGIGYYKDPTAVPGGTYQYIITPTSLSTGAHPVWGMKVTVPQAQAGESDADALSRLAETQAAAAAAASQTTVTWDTFIPQAKIDAPPAGCTYSGSGYQYGGDNRSYDWTSSRYRTALNAVITWSTKQVDGYKAVGSTSVYNKSTGALVATKTASTSNMEARKLGSGSNYVDIRLVNHASNPFCSVGAIDGAISMKVTQGGNWSIISGNHRQMPNHHIYIYNGGTVTDVYRRNYANALCLIGSATCPLADLTGYYGSYS